MRIHIIIASALALLPFAAQAQTCTLKQIASMNLLMMDDFTRAMVPVTVDGVPKLFLLDTGGHMTQMSKDAAQDLELPQYPASVGLVDIGGGLSHAYVAPKLITFGTLKAENQKLMVSPASMRDDGILGPDLMFRYDLEVDFGAGKFNYFSQDHCPGKVVYWTDPASVAVVPLDIRERKIYIQVTLDGKPFEAMVDTGAPTSVINTATARADFGLDTDSPGVTPAGHANGYRRLPSYKYTFAALGFEGVEIKKPTLTMIPYQTGMGMPKIILGMDIMRHLHIYMAMKEKQFYVSAASPPAEEAREPGQSRNLDDWDKAVALSPRSWGILSRRGFERALENVKLDDALADCDRSLEMKPDNAIAMNSRGFVLFRLGRFQEALQTYDKVLAKEPSYPIAIFMRGQVKKKLGDSAGGSADIAAARKLDPAVLDEFKSGDISAD